MNLSESQISEYKKKAEEIVQNWLSEKSGDCFVRTCVKCNTPLRDDSITGEEIIFIVTTHGSFMENDSQVYYRCPSHSDDAEVLAEQLLMGWAVSITGIVQKKDDFILDTKDIKFHHEPLRITKTN